MLAVLAAEFARAMHDEAMSTRNFKESAIARNTAMAAISEVILALRADRQHEDPFEKMEDEENLDPIRSLAQGDGTWVEASWRGKPYEVRVVDEAGKLSLNKLSSAQLAQIFYNLEIPDDEAQIIADSIIDWRDGDDMHQPEGAETEYYEDLPRPYRAKNAAFDSVDELLLVRGVTRELYEGNEDYPGFKEIFSVFNTSVKVNMRSVSPAVMQALGGLNREDAEQLSFDRRRGGEEGIPDALRALLDSSAVGSGREQPPVDMTIEARVKAPDSDVVLAYVGAVIHLGKSGDGLRVARWYDSIFTDSDQSGSTDSVGEASDEG
ncbi:MAG TPA: hypothetical protein VEC57_02920 [Candidatus Limnocylindrales bacterium]|nr:hypothetical protein [Candidatus Limnocylindrales bacterium]